jgi:drug/metabolite transporter superfamily protein YnfA
MPLAPIAPISLGALLAAATDAGLVVLSAASWPEATADDEVPPLAGFIESAFSPLLAEVAARALRRRPEPRVPGVVTAIVMVTALGDLTSATRVAAAVDAGMRVSPLLFFQSVPNAVAGYLAARWDLTGPVVCVSGMSAGLGIAALLIDDADADDALVIRIDLAAAGDGLDRGAALLVTRPDRNDPLTA